MYYSLSPFCLKHKIINLHSKQRLLLRTTTNTYSTNSSRSVSFTSSLLPTIIPSKRNNNSNAFVTSLIRSSSYSTLPSYHIQPITSSSSSTITAYDEAIHNYLSLSGDPLQALNTALQTDNNCIMVHIIHACLILLGTSVNGNHPLIQESRKAVSLLIQKHYKKQITLTNRELIAALGMEALANGRWRYACQLWENQLATDPADITFLRLAHDTYFFLGDSRNLRDGIGRSWSIWTPTMPNYGRITGMLAFGLEENAIYDKAEELAMASLGMDPTDAWATHAAAHVYEMMGRREEGERLLRETENEWNKANMFSRHIYWHWALFALQTGTVGYRQAMSYYDQALGSNSAEQSQADVLGLVDASALLWRLELFHHPFNLLPHPKHADKDNLPPSKDYVPSIIRKDDKELLRKLMNTAKQNNQNRISSSYTTRWNQLAYHWKHSLTDILTTNQHISIFNDIHAAMVLGANENWHKVSSSSSSSESSFLPSVSSEQLLHSLSVYTNSSSLYTNDDWLTNLVKRDGYQLQEILGTNNHINHQYSILPTSIYSTVPSSSSSSVSANMNDNWAVTSSIGKTMAEAMVAFTKNEYVTCYQGLSRTRPYWSLIGGSHAQRDIFEQTLIFAAVGANQWAIARALCSERVVNRSNDGLAWYLYGSILNRIANGDYLPIDQNTKEIYLSRAADYKSRAYVLGVDQGPSY